jgi:predicted RNase H-like HicB family nuclease
MFEDSGAGSPAEPFHQAGSRRLTAPLSTIWCVFCCDPNHDDAFLVIFASFAPLRLSHRSAMSRATYEMLPDQTFYGKIPGLAGVFANSQTLESCRTQLQEVLEGWWESSEKTAPRRRDRSKDHRNQPKMPVRWRRVNDPSPPTPPQALSDSGQAGPGLPGTGSGENHCRGYR